MFNCLIFWIFWIVLDLKSQQEKKTRKQWRHVIRRNAYKIIREMKNLRLVNLFFPIWTIYLFLKKALGKSAIEDQAKVEAYLREQKTRRQQNWQVLQKTAYGDAEQEIDGRCIINRN